MRLVRDKLFVNGHLYAPEDVNDAVSVNEEFTEVRSAVGDHDVTPPDIRGAVPGNADASHGGNNARSSGSVNTHGHADSPVSSERWVGTHEGETVTSIPVMEC